jgi:hypothetical protein
MPVFYKYPGFLYPVIPVLYNGGPGDFPAGVNERPEKTYLLWTRMLFDGLEDGND